MRRKENRGAKPKRHYAHPRDTFHAFMLEGARFDPVYDMPIISPDVFVPKALVPFSVAKRDDWDDFDCTVTFCERDADIEPFWNRPERYLEKLLLFDGVIGMDLSTCWDFPKPLKEWNAYRNRACDFYLQHKGQRVVPLLHGDPDILERELAGLPHGSPIAVSPRGRTLRIEERRRFKRDLRALVDEHAPQFIISYGPNLYGVLDYPKSLGIPVYQYKARGRGDLGGGAPYGRYE